MTAAQIPESILARKCGYCGAKPGEPCETKQTGAWHQDREGWLRTMIACLGSPVDQRLVG